MLSSNKDSNTDTNDKIEEDSHIEDLETTLSSNDEYNFLALDETSLDNFSQLSNKENPSKKSSEDSKNTESNIMEVTSETGNIFEDLFNVKNDSFFGSSTSNFFKSIFGNPRSKSPSSDLYKQLSFKDAGIRYSYSTGPNPASIKTTSSKTLSIFFDLKRYLNNKEFVKDPRNRDIHSFSVKIYSKTIEVAFKHSNYLLKGLIDRHPLLSTDSVLKSSILTDQGILIAVFLI